MKELEEMILKQGIVLEGDVLKVGSFLNQQVDVNLLSKMAKDVKKHFGNIKIDKILTIEASGLPFATLVALEYNSLMVFAKKNKTSNLSGELITSTVKSYTHNEITNIFISKEYIKEGENVLIVDDFLARGEALNGMIDIVNKASGNVVGAAIAIEKKYQNGGDNIRAKGYDVYSLALIKEMKGNKIIFY